MKAIVKTQEGSGNVKLTEYEKPVPGRGEVRVAVKSAGVCGTDIKILRGDTWSNPPVVLGHEYSGVVDALGEDADAVKLGDRVISETGQSVCGQCYYCKTGRRLMCPNRLSIGYGVDGAFAEYIVVSQDIVHKIPDSISFDEAALCEPFAVALHGVWDSVSLLPVDTALVTGPGAIGQLAALAAKAKGAAVILAGTPGDGERLEIAARMGIEHTTANLNEGIVRDLTEGRGVDVAIDCTGAESAIRQAIGLVRPAGKFVQIGLTKDALEIDYALLTGREISIVGSFGHQWHNWDHAIRLLAGGKVNVKPLITGHYPIEKWEQAFDDMEKQRGIKILIHP
ncbi:MAG: alcohol dehydrogenase catalytic domain-containing protein [Clostridiales Family XIII bacterium]|jgi:L-iditol 2-dehydrogenase|nr:alcohol dehydrogenase catalytic domain-containing protein [Clostridiales Family XIII bacterium]